MQIAQVESGHTVQQLPRPLLPRNPLPRHTFVLIFNSLSTKLRKLIHLARGDQTCAKRNKEHVRGRRLPPTFTPARTPPTPINVAIQVYVTLSCRHHHHHTSTSLPPLSLSRQLVHADSDKNKKRKKKSPLSRRNLGRFSPEQSPPLSAPPLVPWKLIVWHLGFSVF